MSCCTIGRGCSLMKDTRGLDSRCRHTSEASHQRSFGPFLLPNALRVTGRRARKLAHSISSALRSNMNGNGRTVLVTGAAGLVGTHTCRALAANGWRVRALVRNRGKAEARLSGVPVEFAVADLRDAGAIADAVRGATAIVHLAAIAIERPGQRYETVNTDATVALIAAARAAEVTRFVQMSQNGASSASPHRFLRSKGLAEDAVRDSGLAWTSLRPSVIVGAEDEFVNVLARLVRLSPIIYPLPGGGTTRFQPVAVGDVAAAVRACLERDDTIGQAYTLGGPEPLTLRTITERVLTAMGEHRILLDVPVAALRPLVALAQMALPNPPVTTGLLALLASDNVTPDSALLPVFGITPTPFTPATLAYLRDISARDALRSLFTNA